MYTKRGRRERERGGGKHVLSLIISKAKLIFGLIIVTWLEIYVYLNVCFVFVFLIFQYLYLYFLLCSIFIRLEV